MLRLTEIYKSLQGESSWSGWPCTFIRLTGCDLRCTWCDTTHGFRGGEQMSIEQIIAQVEKENCKLVEVTGGEPLLQKETPELIKQLLDLGYTVLIETGGHIDISVLDERCHRIVDMKCPGSEMQDRNLLTNLDLVKKGDEVKFVINDEADFIFAQKLICDYNLEQKCEVLLSPVFGSMCLQKLATLLLDSGIKARLQIQLHKLIWNADKKGV